MFRDKLYVLPIRNETQVAYVDRNITVHEHRAPTDESLALLREMEKKVREEILQGFELPIHNGTCYLQVVRMPEAIGHSLSVRAIMNFNGKNVSADVIITDMEIRNEEQFVSKMKETMAKVIMEFMIGNIDDKKSTGYEHLHEFFNRVHKYGLK